MNSSQYPRTLADRLISGWKATGYFLREPLLLRWARYKHEDSYSKKSENPLISVVMPTYHRGKLLVERTLPSILSQTYQNFEVVIVGNYETDNTKELLSKIKDPRIRYYEMPSYDKYPKYTKARWHVGGAPERNKGLELARGKWIAETDDDDIFTPDHLEALLHFAQEENYEFVSACYEREKYGKREIVDAKGEIPRIGGIETIFYRSYLKLFKYNIDCWRKSYNRPQEIDRYLRIYNAGVRIGFLDKVVTYVLPLPGMETVGLDALEIKTGEKLR